MVVSKHITGPPAPHADLLSVMHDRMRTDDQILSTLRSGQGASLTIRYYLGRKRHAAMRPPTVTEPVRSAEERPDPSESCTRACSRPIVGNPSPATGGQHESVSLDFVVRGGLRRCAVHWVCRVSDIPISDADPGSCGCSCNTDYDADHPDNSDYSDSPDPLNRSRPDGDRADRVRES